MWLSRQHSVCSSRAAEEEDMGRGIPQMKQLLLRWPCNDDRRRLLLLLLLLLLLVLSPPLAHRRAAPDEKLPSSSWTPT
jgi:hypothetical protein